MTKKQRITSVLQGKPVDRIPASFSLHFPESCFFGKSAIEAHRKFYLETDVDLLKIMNENKFSTDTVINTADDWNHVRPISGNEPYVQDQLNIIKAMADEFGDEVHIFATIHGIFASAFHATNDKPENLARHDKVSAHLKERPEVVGPALKRIAEGLALLTRLCIEAGSAGIYYAALGAEKYRFSREVFNAHIKPNDLLILEAASEAPAGTILHMCKDQLNIDVYKDYPGDAVNWAEHELNIDLDTGRKLFNRPILGGFDDRSGVLVEGAKEELEKETRRLVKTFGPTGFMIGADCTLPTEIPYSRVRWVTDTLKETELMPVEFF